MANRVREAATTTRLRADARRNRDRILAAAREIFVDQGADAPLDAIATRAGVGIATLYRRFPSRRALATAVVRDLLGQMAREAELALAEESNAFQALARYMHRVLDLRVSAVIPALLGQVAMDEDDIPSLNQRSAVLLQAIIDRAQAEGSLRTDVTFGDIGLLLSRLAHPLPAPIAPTLDIEVAHRHLTLFLDALRADRTSPAPALPGPAVTYADLRVLAAQGHRPSAATSRPSLAQRDHHQRG